MGTNDKLAIVTFTKTAAIKLDLTQMTDIGKTKANNAIDSLKAGGGTNIYSGLEKALDLITDVYTSEEKVAFEINTCYQTTNTKQTIRYKYTKEDIDYFYT
jgi:uncharacterized protein YegL